MCNNSLRVNFMISRPFGQNSNNFSNVKSSNFSRKIKYPLESFWLLKQILLLSVLWFSAASVNAPTFSFEIKYPVILDALLPSRGFDVYGQEVWGGGGGRRARYSGFQVTRMIKGFLKFEIFDSGFLDLSGDFGGYLN